MGLSAWEHGPLEPDSACSGFQGRVRCSLLLSYLEQAGQVLEVKCLAQGSQALVGGASHQGAREARVGGQLEQRHQHPLEGHLWQLGRCGGCEIAACQQGFARAPTEGSCAHLGVPVWCMDGEAALAC